MSDNYPSDVKLDENQNGTVSFATDVVATIAGLAANEVEGVASMSSSSSGFADMFRKSSRNYTKGVHIDLDGNKVAVDVTIVVEYGSPVPDVARGIQENVKKAIETMSGLDVRKVDVHISGISFEREQRAARELDEQQKKLLVEESEEVEETVDEEADVEQESEDDLTEEPVDEADDEAEAPSDEETFVASDESEEEEALPEEDPEEEFEEDKPDDEV